MTILDFQTKDNSGIQYSIQLIIYNTSDMSFRIWETSDEKNTGPIRYTNKKVVDWEYDGTQAWYHTPPEVRRFVDDICANVLRNLAFL